MLLVLFAADDDGVDADDACHFFTDDAAGAAAAMASSIARPIPGVVGVGSLRFGFSELRSVVRFKLFKLLVLILYLIALVPP